MQKPAKTKHTTSASKTGLSSPVEIEPIGVSKRIL